MLTISFSPWGRSAPDGEVLPGSIHEQSTHLCTEAGLEGYFPDCGESIALRSPCFAHPFNPASFSTRPSFMNYSG
jgi:hypothetical protein